MHRLFPGFILLCSACLTTSIPTAGQTQTSSNGELGLPYIQNYTAKEYGAHNQIWDLVQDDRGLMYFATNPGPVEYDGVSWRVIPTANSSFALSIDKDSNGTIYVGAIDEIGYLKPDSVGSMHYASMLSLLPEEEKKLGIVWRTFANTEGVYFQSFTKIIRYNLEADTEEDRIKIWKPTEGNRFSLSSLINNTLYVQEMGKGMLVMEEDSLQLMPGGETFATWQVPVLLPYGNDQFLAVTIRNGLFLHDGSTFNRFESEADPFLIEQLRQPSHGVLLPDSTYMLTFVRGGVVQIDGTGKVIQTIEESDGLNTNDVKKAYLDNQNGLWLGLNNGISRIEIPSPFSVYNQGESFDGNIETIAKYNDELYIGTNQNLYKMVPATEPGEHPTFSVLPEIVSHIWGLASVVDGLLVGASNGLYIVQNGTVTLLEALSSSAAYHLYQSPSDKDRVYVGLTYGLGLLTRESGTWTYKGAYNGISVSVRSAVEDEEGNLWLGTDNHGTLFVEKPPKDNVPEFTPIITTYAGDHGLAEGIVMPLMIGSEIRFATTEGLRSFNQESQTFEPDHSFGEPFESTQIFRYAIDSRGQYWIRSGGFIEGKLGVLKPNGEAFSWTHTPFSKANQNLGMIRSILPDDESQVIWFGGDTGLVRYDPAVQQQHTFSFSSHIRSTKVRNDSLIFGGMHDGAITPVLDYVDDALRFEYATTSFDLSEQNMYQVRLDPFDKQWGDWTNETTKDYTNLPENDYTFRVRARNIYNEFSEEATFSFTLLPPWYRTWWAYGIYALLGIGFIYGMIRIRTAQLQKRNLRLEDIIEDRTQEILRQSEEIQQKNVQLEQSLETLATTQGQLIHAEKMASLGKMATGIAHEIKNPLNFVTNFSTINEQLIDELAEELEQKTDRAANGDLNDLKDILNDLRFNSKSILKHGQRADSIVVSLMQHASGGRGQKTEADLNAMLKESVELVSQMAVNRSGGLNIDFEKHIENQRRMAVVNLGDLQRVLVNLLENAVDAVTERSKKEEDSFAPRITVRSELSGDHQEIRISDNGIGIPEDIKHQIFEPFFTTKPTGSGTGLGLSLSYDIITEGHNGSLTLEESQEGTTFLIRIPHEVPLVEITDQSPAS